MVERADLGALPRRGARARLAAVWDSDLAYSFRRSPVTVVAAAVTLVVFGGAAFAPWLAPHNPFDLATLDLLDAFTPPVWEARGDRKFLLGTDDQGRDMLSTIMFGARLSLLVGVGSVVFALVLGVGLGLLAGYVGGRVESVIMRVADVQLSFPAILIALLIDGVARVAMPRSLHDQLAVPVLIAAIGVSGWVQYARTVRGSTLVEKSKEYVQAARVIGIHPLQIMLRHVLPNVLGPVLVIATIHLALAIITEATLSFLGVGVPPTQPSLGTLVRIGNAFLFSGEWWITLFPGLALIIMVLAVNLLGDWLRDALESEAPMSAAPPGTGPGTALLAVENLRVEFKTRRGNLVAVDDISFALKPGEVLGVVGESGAGKSLTGAAIIGLLEPPGRITGGRVVLDGQRIDNLPPEAMRRIRGAKIGAVFQDPLTSLNPLYTIGRQLTETIETHLDLGGAAARARAIELLHEVGIPAAERRIDAYPHQFSGGMRQRVVIALALCANPRLIIADEPTTALDVSIQAQIIALLKRVCRTHDTAVMLITHDMGVIAETADRVAVMYAGRIVEIGTVGDVILRPRHPYTVGLMGSIPRLGLTGERLTQIEGSMPRLDAIPRGCPFNPRCPDVFLRCHVERPELAPTGSSHAACWLHVPDSAKVAPVPHG